MRKYAVGLKMLLIQWTGLFPSQSLRQLLYRYVFGMKVRGKVTIYGKSDFRKPERITIGDGTIVGEHCMLDGRREIVIGSNVNISSGVWIWTLHHDIQSKDFAVIGAPVKIEDRVWLCSRCTILPGVSIGYGAVVASGAVVTKEVEPFAIVGGVPAKKIGERNRDELNYELTKYPIPFI